MIAKLKAWLQDHSITTHSVASAYTILIGYYAVSADFRNQVAATYQAIYSHIPASLRPWVGITAGLYVWYRSGKKKDASQVQTTNPQMAVQKNPNKPTGA